MRAPLCPLLLFVAAIACIPAVTAGDSITWVETDGLRVLYLKKANNDYHRIVHVTGDKENGHLEYATTATTLFSIQTTPIIPELKVESTELPTSILVPSYVYQEPQWYWLLCDYRGRYMEGRRLHLCNWVERQTAVTYWQGQLFAKFSVGEHRHGTRSDRPELGGTVNIVARQIDVNSDGKVALLNFSVPCKCS